MLFQIVDMKKATNEDVLKSQVKQIKKHAQKLLDKEKMMEAIKFMKGEIAQVEGGNKYATYNCQRNLILLSGRYNALQQYKIAGTRSKEFFLSESTKIKEALDLVINRLDDLTKLDSEDYDSPAYFDLDPYPDSYFNHDTTPKVFNQKLLMQLMVILQALILLGIGVVIFLLTRS